MTDFAGLMKRLSDARVEFILVGGAAATAHGSARLTDDVDIVYARSSDNLARLVAALGPLQPYLRGAPAGLPFRFDVETLEALIKVKRAAGRPKDLQAIAELEALSDERKR